MTERRFFTSSPSILKPHPRKGTETHLRDHRSRRIGIDFKTISPQGDGNDNCVYRSPGFSSWAISKPYPRKGTETGDKMMDPSSGSKFQNHIPARGRKLSHDVTLDVPCTTCILKPHPRKGTETCSDQDNNCGTTPF